VPYSAVWAAGLFVVLGAFVFLFTFGLATGLKVLDENTHRFVDLLVDTESELAKVAWPGRDELGRSTGAVLVLILVLGAFLYIVDQIVAYVFGLLRVLPQ
jgi:preprotein translocase SecE subunit